MRTWTDRQVRNMLSLAIDKAGGQRAFGREHGLSAVHVGRVEGGEKLSPAILKALGLEVHKIEATYRRLRK